MFTSDGGARFRHGPWRGSALTAQIVPIGGGPINEAAVVQVFEVVSSLGFSEFLTSALGPAEQEPFLAVGFRVHETLRLLELSLDDDAPARPSMSTRRMRRRDLAPSLAIDASSFTSFWQFDAEALREALSATPKSRRRVVRSGANVLGYAVTGHAGTTGFIQRLAVEPQSREVGIGSSLLADGLCWLHGRRVRTVLVNTQPENRAALSLYERFGFVDRPGGLAVLRFEGSLPATTLRPTEEMP